MATYYKDPTTGATYTQSMYDIVKERNPNINLQSYSTDVTGRDVNEPVTINKEGWYVKGGQAYNPSFYNLQGNALSNSGQTVGGTGGVASYLAVQQPQVQDNSALIRQMYEEQKQSALAQLKQAIASSKAKYQTQLSEAPDKYRNLRNAVSTNYYKGISPLREALANTGNLNSGMGRQEQLEAATAMQNDINALNTQQQQYENQINQAIADLENSGSLQEAQIASDNATKLLEALIGEGNRVSSESYQRLRDALARSDKLAELGYNQTKDIASSLGYVNPYAQYVITPEIEQLLAPYANDYAAFIQANPDHWLVPYAKNARFQKMLANPAQFAAELEQYRTPDYMSGQLKNALTQAQINSTNALANQRSTPTTTSNNATALNNAAIRAQNEINSLRNNGEEVTPAQEQEIYNKWLRYYGVTTISDSDIVDYLK